MIKKANIDADESALFLSGVKIFLALDSDVIHAMALKIQCFAFSQDEALIERGTPGKYMMILISGHVQVCLQDRRVNLKKGAVIGEMALLSGITAKANVIAVCDTEVLAISRTVFNDLMLRYQQLAIAMTDFMQSRLDRAQGIRDVGKYKVTGKLGEGGMSIVYSAYDPDLEREVALKMLKYEVAASPEFRQLFQQEAVTIARLNHPNILHVIETVQAYSTEFIVIEKIQGKDLGQYLKTEGAFSQEKTCEILSQVAKALHYAHEKAGNCIIHRDVKPSNIIIDNHGLVKLMDFGIACAKGHHANQVAGTVEYLAPEAIKNLPIDKRMDIYALGITAFTLLTGHPPFQSSDYKSVLAQHLYDDPPDITEIIPNLSDNLAEFVQRALIKEPEHRLSNWNDIELLLTPVKSDTFGEDQLGVNERGIFIKIANQSYVNFDKLMPQLEKVLDKNCTAFSMQTIKKN